MKLAEYLRAIRECPDEKVEYTAHDGEKNRVHRLIADYGVYDNYPILLGIDFEKLLNDVQRWGFTLSTDYESTDEDGFKRVFFNFNPTGKDNILVGIYNRASFLNDVLTLKDLYPNGERHRREQNVRYRSSLMLHGGCKQLVPAIERISEHIQDGKISACFLKSPGWGDKSDLSRIVYFPDEDEVTICGVSKS